MSLIVIGAFVALVIACKLVVVNRLDTVAPEWAERHHGHWE